MGTHFVGSEDIALCASQGVTTSAPWVGAWFEPSEAEIYELLFTVAALQATKNAVIIIEADNGIVDGSQRVIVLGTLTRTSNGTSYLDINLGTLPGSRRIRARATSSGDATGATITASLREGRSGLLNQ
jgi:ABC-type cobalt transport system substrate-binding protein